MFAITGITGQVGSQLATQLLQAGCQVRAVLRDKGKATAWAERGCDIALASMDDAGALAQAFTGAEAVFVLLPPNFDPQPGFPEARAHVAALVAALRAAAPARVVCLSTVGAQAAQQNLLTQLQLMETALSALPMPVTCLRAAWFMENTAWDIDSAKRLGVIPTFLQPADKAVPMVATRDVAQRAAQLLQETPPGHRVVELEGPVRITPDELAATLGRVLGREVLTQPVPRDTWDALFRSQGMAYPLPRMQMLDGFNQGWISFEGDAAATDKGTTPLETVLRELLAS